MTPDRGGEPVLALRPRPIEGESLAGHLMRALSVNGASWSRKTLATRGIHLAGLLVGGEGPAVDRLLGPRADALRGATVRNVTARRVELRGEELHRDDFTTQLRRWCPGCWQEDLARPAEAHRPPGWTLHRRAWWDVVAVGTCPSHALRLEARCPDCATEVTWREGSLDRCTCGACLTAAPGAPVDAASTAADAYVLGRLGFLPLTQVPFLDALPLRVAIDAMERLGVTKLGGARGALSKFPPERWPEVHSEGLRVAADWPGGFDALLDALAEGEGVGHWGAEKLYGYLYLWAKQLGGSSGTAARERLAVRYAARGFVRRDSVVATLTATERLSLTDVVAREGRTEALVRCVVDHLGFLPPVTRRGTPINVTPEQADQVRAFLDDAIEQGDLPLLLGVSLNTTKTLIRAGIVAPYGLKVGGRRKRNQLFSRVAVGRLTSEFTDGRPRLREVPEGCRTLAAASKAAGIGSVAVLLGRLRAGEVAAEGVIEPPTLGNLVFRDRALRAAHAALSGGAVTLLEAGSSDLGSSIIAAAIDAGLIEAAPGGAGRPRVRPAALRAFWARYVTTSRLSRDLGCARRWVLQGLRRAGVRPVLDRSRDRRCTSAIWDRSTLPAQLEIGGANTSKGDEAASDAREDSGTEITDAQWARVSRVLLSQRGRRGSDDRKFVEAFVWVARHGARWSRLPKRYGPWSTAYCRYHRRVKRSAWDQVLLALDDELADVRAPKGNGER